VVKFVEEVAEAPLAQAPAEIREQAQEALEAARLALQLAELDAMQKALREINEFYALIRAEAKRLRDMDEDEEELLLLAA
jgi:predicted nucleotide-binding protein (sugar kinase/HSP70/actin superfamily)